MTKKIGISAIAAVAVLATTVALWARGISEDERTKIFSCMLKSPYQWMFEPKLPEKTVGYKPGELTTYMAGTRGVLYYADLAGCAGSLLKKLPPKMDPWADPAPLFALAGVKPQRDKVKAPLTRAYHPDIVRWALNNLVPQPKEKLMGETYQSIYNRTFKRLAHLLALTYAHLHTKKGRLKVEKKFYKKLVAESKGDGGKFFEKLDNRYNKLLPQFQNQGYSTLKVSYAMGFWLRRNFDRTDQELWRGLKGILDKYEPLFLARNNLQKL